MASSWTTLGEVTDSNDETVRVSQDRAGWVRLTGQHDALEFTPEWVAVLRELLDRAAMPGQPPPVAEAPRGCSECQDGLVAIGRCNCGSPADESVSFAHQRLCGFGPCPNGCWSLLHPEAPPAGRVLAGEEAALERVRVLAGRWAALSGDSMGAAVDRRIGGVLLDAISKDPRTPEARLEHVRQLAEHWLTPGATLFYPEAGQRVLDAINTAP